MKALTLIEPGRCELRDIEPPTVKPDTVRLRVEHVGFCGGDLNGYRGLFPLQEYPNVLGHEVGAVIEEVGPDVPDRFRPDMRVTMSPYSACEKCVACQSNRAYACVDNKTMGVRRPGAMTRHITAHWKDLYTSNTLTSRELALVEPLTVGFHGVDRGRVTQDDTVAVFGTGIVGQGAIAGAAARGAQVIAIDISDAKLEIAGKVGATETINSASCDLHERLQALTDRRGPNVMIEAVGLPATYRAAIDEVAFTGRVVYIGYGKIPVEYETRWFVQKELDILGSRNCNPPVDFPMVIDVLETGQFPVGDAITRQVSLSDAADALLQWDSDPGRVTKIMVDIDA